MTQIPVPPSLAGVTPEQMQAMINFFFQHQPGAQIPSTTSPSAPEHPSSSINASLASADMDLTADGYIDVGAVDSATPAADCPPTPLKTPPRRKAVAPVPSTPRAQGNLSNSNAIPATAASTPSSKMAQLTLEGRMLASTPTPNAKRRAGGVSSATRKGPLPTGHDPLLIFEEVPPVVDDGGHPPVHAGEECAKKDSDGDESDPYEGFPEIVTKESAERALALHSDTPTIVPASTATRRKRNEPTTARWMNTRRTRTSSEASPPPVQGSPKKKARVASPSASPVPSPTFKATKSSSTKSIASPFESPDSVKDSDVRALERILESVRRGEKIPALSEILQEVRLTPFLDTEAVCSDGETDEDDDGNLKGFVVNDDVVEYDVDAPALPDDDVVRPKRLFKRTRRGDRDIVNDKDAKTDDFSDIEIVPTLDKGKGRAPPPPPSPEPVPVAGPSVPPHSSRAYEDDGATAPDEDLPVDPKTEWQTAQVHLANAVGGLHPGSTAVDQNAPVCASLVITPDSPVHSWEPFSCDTLTRMGYTENTFDVPGDCALILSDYKDDGWGTPSVDIVAAAETHVHVGNLLRGMQFRRHGPYINESQVNPEELDAVDVSPPSGTTRYKIVIKETRAPAVSITPCIVRYWRLDNPTAGPHPVYYICATPFEGCFDRAVALECMKLGQRELYCIAFNNAIRMSTLPSFDRPSGGPTTNKVKPSSSIRRGKNAPPPSRRGSNFELSTNDTMTILDARTVPLPRDMSTWHTSLPVFEGVPPKDAVALVAHTTNMWVGTRTSPPSYNVQYNLVYIILLGSLPAGFV